MDINFLDIQITDRLENGLPLSFEDASVESIKLVYNGQDDKFGNILTSELQFTFLVKENTTAKYFHLFTGSETRYKVELVDVSDSESPKIIWVGHLLPEQFSEPYKNGGFFVEFVATDGIARLKDIDYAYDDTAVQQSVLAVLNKCLIATGLELPIYFSEAFQNEGFTIDYRDLEINTDCYLDDKKVPKSAGDVLENVLVSIGCSIFLYNNAWYIIGLNKYKETTLSFSKYTLDGNKDLVFDSQVNSARDLLTTKFVAHPSVAILPPLKKVETDWDWDASVILIPDDVVTALPVNIDSNIEDRTSKYWNLTTDESLVFGVWLILLSDYDYENINFLNGFADYLNKDLINSYGRGPFIYFDNESKNVTLADLDTNYVDLKTSFFIEGYESSDWFASLEIEFVVKIDEPFLPNLDLLMVVLNIQLPFTSVADNGAGFARINLPDNHNLQTNDIVFIYSIAAYEGFSKITVIDANTFDIEKAFTVTAEGTYENYIFRDNFNWAITRKDHLTGGASDEEIYISSFADPAFPEGSLSFEISVDSGFLKGVLKIDKIAITDDGWYNLRLYPVVTHQYLESLIVYKKVNLELSLIDSVSVIKKRTIDYSAKHSVDVFHGTTRMDASIKALQFSPALETQIENGELVAGTLVLTPIAFSVFDQGFGLDLVIVTITPGDYYKLDNGYTLYLIKQGETVAVEVPSSSYALSTTSTLGVIGAYYIIQQQSVSTPEIYYLEETNIFLIKALSTSVDLAYGQYWIDRWHRYDVTEAKPMQEIVADMYHGLLNTFKFTVNGTYLQLVSPLDMVLFTFRNTTKYYPVNIEMNLHQNTTEVTMVEAHNEAVSDYE